MLAQTILRGSLGGVFLAWLALPAKAQSTPHVDEANHFEAQVPEGWHPIQETLVDALSQPLQEQAANKRSRYVGGYSMSPKGELTLPYVLLQVTDDATNRMSESGLIRAFNAESSKREVTDALSKVLEKADMEATWDPVAQQMIIPLAGDVPGIGPVRGISVARVGSFGFVSMHCYARASEFDAAMPAFEAWIDGLRIDPDYQWKPGSEGGIDWHEVSWVALVCAVAGGLGALVFARLRRSHT